MRYSMSNKIKNLQITMDKIIFTNMILLQKLSYKSRIL